MKERYGKALFKVPVDFNFGCPHRDGDLKGGCTFCPEDGSRAVQIMGIDRIEDQIERAMEFARGRYNATGFAAYVQAYTATFAPVSKFREQMLLILGRYPFDSLHLGTRPDCLPSSTLDYLEVLSQEVDLWVELGLQTIHNKTLEFIQRGHDWECSLKGIEKLKKRGLQVVSHLILGLPGESREDMLETARVMGELPLDGIKVHNLHVIRGTEMERQHGEKPFKMLDELEYVELLAEVLRLMPGDLPIMRITTDTPEHDLIAPHWNLEKGQIKEALIQHMEYLGIRQGDLHPSGTLGDRQTRKKGEVLETRDGSRTIRCPETGEPYHPRSGALQQAKKTYLDNSQLKSQHSKSVEQPYRILDIGFGVGYNSFLALDELKDHASSIEILAFERDRVNTGAFVGKHEKGDWNDRLGKLMEGEEVLENSHRLKVLWGEARYRLREVKPASADLIWLDGFDDRYNAEMVTYDLMTWLRSLLKKDGRLISAKSHRAFCLGLQAAGFEVSRLDGKHGVMALPQSGEVGEIPPTSSAEGELLYRDPNLCWSHRAIVRERNSHLSVGA
jgi:radical SAM protein (TIGR01212 family)